MQVVLCAIHRLHFSLELFSTREIFSTVERYIHKELTEAAVVLKGLIVSVITIMRTSQTEASEPQLVR